MRLFWPENRQFEEMFQTFKTEKINQLFSKEITDFIAALSQRFLKMRHLPEVVALGYWLRKSNIQQMRVAFEHNSKDEYVKPRGIAFHIAPSNVDTIFIYSWMLSLMAGNKNIIRLSNKVEMTELLSIVIDELKNHELIGNQTIICTYNHNEEYTQVISGECHLRIIWGGDQTIQAIRRIELAPLANELVFADRFSLAVINLEALESATETELDKLVGKFYNDSFWFDQMACSSPRLIVWTGEGDRSIFWQALEEKIKEKNYDLLAAVQMTKFTTAMQLAPEELTEKIEVDSYLSKVQLNGLTTELKEKHCGGGLFYEYKIDCLSEITSIISDKDQTLSYFGFSKEELKKLMLMIDSRGIDRIVPIGQALDFNGVWDGQSFLNSFTRKIVIK